MTELLPWKCMHQFYKHESILDKFIINTDTFYILYFFSYKAEFFSFQNNPKNLDPSYKVDLNL